MFYTSIQVLQENNLLGSPGNFSALPTNPRDWIVMDALPEQLNHWQANALYIIGDKPVLQDIPEDLYPNCTFVPVEVSRGEGWGGRGGGGWERQIHKK